MFPPLIRSAPLAVGGAFAFGDARQLIAKSPRSALLLQALWGPARLMGALRRDRAGMERLLQHWGALGRGERLEGVLLFRPRDARGRVYLIGRGEEKSVFAKIGADVGVEALAAPQVLGLEAAGFAPQLPFARHRHQDLWVNLYRYIPQAEMTKRRLTLAQTGLFGAALNPAGSGQTVALREYLGPEALALIAGLPGWLAAYPVALGRIHGDLMSPNLLQAPSGTGPIAVLDWESAQEAGPLILDRIGGLDWAQVVVMAQAACRGDDRKPDEAEALAFMALSAARGFRPAREWLLKGARA
jgi:hypothetical protein